MSILIINGVNRARLLSILVQSGQTVPYMAKSHILDVPPAVWTDLRIYKDQECYHNNNDALLDLIENALALHVELFTDQGPEGVKPVEVNRFKEGGLAAAIPDGPGPAAAARTHNLKESTKKEQKGHSLTPESRAKILADIKAKHG